LVQRNAIGSHGPSDVLQISFAEIGERGLHAAINLLMDYVRNTDAAGLRNALKARRDIDAIAKDIVAIDDDVADVDADT
jgi:hypothetical protein